MQGLLYSLAREFLQYLEAERGCSPLTVRSYQSDLTHLFTHLKGLEAPDDLAALTLGNARSWVVAMHRGGLSASSVCRRVSCLKSFVRYLEEHAQFPRSDIARLRPPAREKTLPTFLSAEELASLLRASLRQRVAYNAFRDHAILLVLVFTGIRRGELLNLKVSDVDLATGTLRVVNGKGRKTRVVPLVAEATEAVGDWLTFRRTKGHDYLFTTVRGNRIYASRLQVIWKAVLERSGVSRPGVTLHTLRHSMATLLLQSGQADLVAIQHLLGHTRLDTTGIYLHVVPGQLRSAVEAHPLCGAGEEL